MNIFSLGEAAAMALRTMGAHKLRSSLTMLGVGVGVLSILFMAAVIQGLHNFFISQIEELGSNAIWVTKFDPKFARVPTAAERQRRDLTVEDADALRHEAPSVADAAPVRRMTTVTVRYGNRQSATPRMLGVTTSYEYANSSYLDYGRFIGETDLERRANVCVLGQDVARALYPDESPIDKEIKVNGLPFRVIGVMEPLGTFFGNSRDDLILIPLTTFDKHYPNYMMRTTSFVIIVRPRTREAVAAAVDEVTEILRRRRQVPFGAPNDFGISSQESLLEIYNQLTSATALVLVAISCVALLIGGIGVMNIMLVSVTERTKEIGIRKAVGATRANILTQFLVEAAVLTTIGGAAGLVLGEGASYFVNRFSSIPASV
ncbi:MAG TPA: ABC transporter permease, partial [Pyrinomonadaceae bacterium]